MALLCLGIRVVLQLLGMLAVAAQGGSPWDRTVAMWSAWDAPHYLRIAEVGYRPVVAPGDDPLFIVFFPGFPLAVRAVELLIGDLVLAGLVVSYLAGVGASYLLYRLVRLDRGHREAWSAVMLLLCAPTAYYLSAPYSEALFLCAVLGCVYAVRTGRWAAAGWAGAVATGTRVTGVALAPLLLLSAFTGRATIAERARRIGWSALAGAGLAGYLLTNQVVHGDPLHFLIPQREHWNQHAVWPWVPVIDAARALGGGTEGVTRFMYVGRLAAVAVALPLLLVGLRTLRRADAGFGWTALVLVMSASWLLSLPRYVLVIYPLYLVAARLTASRPVVLYPVLTIAALVQAWLFSRYAVGGWTF